MAAKILYTQRKKDSEIHIKEVSEDDRICKMAKLTCLIREKITNTFVSDLKPFKVFFLKMEKMN